jgi:hypothetical protein
VGMGYLSTMARMKRRVLGLNFRICQGEGPSDDLDRFCDLGWTWERSGMESKHGKSWQVPTFLSGTPLS